MKLLFLISLLAAPLVSAITVAQITGERYQSLLNGTSFTNLTGLVTAKGPSGLWLRSTTPDDNERTSESVYVFGAAFARNITRGQIITIDGNVTEYRSSSAYLYLTEVTTPRNLRIVSSSNVVEPVVLGKRTSGLIGRRDVSPPTELYSSLDTNNDIFAYPNNVSRVSAENPRLNPGRFGMDFWESLSGELVTVQGVTALGRPANTFGDQWVYGDWKVTGKNSRDGLTVTPKDANAETVIIGTPLDGTRNVNTTKLGDTLETIVGVVQYNFGFYSILPLTGTKIKALKQPELPPPSNIKSNGKCDGITVGSYNAENFAAGNPRVPQIVEHIVNYMNSPSIVFLQEIQDNNGETNNGNVDANATLLELTTALEARSGLPYSFTDVDPVNNQDGGAPGGNIRNAYIYRSDQIRLYKPNPGGPLDANAVLPGPTLRYNPGRITTPQVFNSSRKPLVAEWETVDGKGHFFTVNVHFTSKGGSSSLQGDPRPPVNGGIDNRIAQGEVTGAFIAEILAQDRNAAVIASGDFNEFSWVRPLERFVEVSGLKELDIVANVKDVERYSYTFGNSQQALDHMFVSPRPARDVKRSDFEHLHLNTWVTGGNEVSDHDPALAKFNVCRS
ncbi:hypothetical protein LTR95_000291 [Oleoguttula sp. CCFEE 5521]